MYHITRLLTLFSMGLLVVTGFAGCDSIVPGSNEIDTDALPGVKSDVAASKVLASASPGVLEGTVFLNDTSDEDVPPDDDLNPGEPGILKAEVALQRKDGGDWKPVIGFPPVLTGDDGTYKFNVLSLALSGGSVSYRVVVAKMSTLGGAINESLFGGVFMPSCIDDCTVEPNPVVFAREFNPSDLVKVDFGFEVDLDGAIAKFDAGGIHSDGFPRKYWYRQARQRGNGNFPLEYSEEEFVDLLNCSGPAPDKCVADFDASIGQVLPFDGDHDLKDAITLLKKVPGSQLSKNQPSNNRDKYGTLQKELQQQIFIAVLNYTIGHGVCIGADRCRGFDEPTMRALIQNAILVLINSDFSVVGKASSGKVSGNSELLSRTN